MCLTPCSAAGDGAIAHLSWSVLPQASGHRFRHRDNAVEEDKASAERQRGFFPPTTRPLGGEEGGADPQPAPRTATVYNGLSRRWKAALGSLPASRGRSLRSG